MRATLLLVIILSFGNIYAQKRKESTVKKDPFLNTQWYLGFFGGANVAGAKPITSYHGYAPLNYNVSEIEKTYNNFSNPGSQYGLVFMFYTKGFTIGIKPGMHIYGIEYSTNANWSESNNTDNAFQVSYKHETKFNYLEVPLTLQYDLIKEKFRPFVGIGAYYGMLLNASHTIERSGTDSASGSEGGFSNQPTTIGLTDSFIKSSVGLIGFAGVSYDPGNIRITLDVGYKYGLNNITNTENRYLNNDLAAIGEATDDLQLQNIYLSLGIVFPLKFISSDFNSIK